MRQVKGWMDENYLEVRTFLDDYLREHPCTICGEDRIPALQFHHRVPSEKKFSIRSHGYRTLDKVKEELKKCDVICANCHFMYHHKYGR